MTVVDSDERRRAATEFGANLVVEAGAGTGKTTLLVERALHAVVAEGAGIHQLVLVTFMERAAEEIRERLSDRLEAALTRAETAQRAQIASALAQLDQATISTIHGLAQRILAEFPVEARVPIGFQVLDAFDAERRWAACWRRWVSAGRSEAAAEILRELLALGEPLETLAEFARAVAAWDTLGAVKEGRPRPDLGEFCRRWATAFGAWCGGLEGVAGPEDPGRRQVEALAAKLAYLGRVPDAARTRAILEWRPGFKLLGNQKNWRPKDRLREQKALIGEFRQQLAARQQEYAGFLLEHWYRAMVDDFLPYWRRFRFHRGYLLFDDLLREARALLAENPRVRQMLFRRWRYIFVDEFQDTDPVQSELLLRLAGDPAADDWTAAAIPPGRLFVVGDEKQSIYRFRGADVETFQAMRSKIVRQGGQSLKIRQNFRSDRAVTEFVNTVFRARMANAPDPERPYWATYDPLISATHRAPDDRVWWLGGPGPKALRERRQQEAEWTGLAISTAILAGWLVQDPEKGGVRPITYRDIAVLVPNRTGISEYRAEFQRRGIPLASLGGVGFFEQDEIRGFSALLALVADPDNPTAWLAFLASPWVGASHSQLEAHVRSAGGLTEAGDDPVGEWVQHVGRWLARRDGWLPVDYFDALDEVSGLREALTVREDRQALANLDKLRELARSYGRAWGLADFESWLSLRVAAGEPEAEGVVEDIGDAVQLSTVHQAKGLEWPMCVVTNWHLERRPMPRLLHDAKTGTMGWRTSHFETADYGSLKAAALDREEAERVRLWYVALTRAREYLVVVESYDEAAGPTLRVADVAPKFPLNGAIR